MGLIDNLTQAHSGLADPLNAPSVDVTGVSDAQALGTLITTFGADDDCTEIRVLRDGGVLGTVQREATLGVLGNGYKGWGSSDGALLPGIANYNTSNWICPLPGCGYTLITIVLGDAPSCARHPLQELQLKA